MIHALPFSLLLSAVVTAAAQTAQLVPRAFSYTFKPGQGIGNVTPITICNHTARQPGMHAATLFWATGSLEWPEFGDTVIKYYVDGETTASVTATINQLTGMFYNHSDPHVAPLSKILPFGNARIGRTGIGGGAYNSIVVPFRTRLLVTAIAAPYSKSTKSVLYSKIAGLENYQHGSVLGRHGMFMSDRVRLRSYASDVVLAPAQRHTICNFNRSSNPSPNSWAPCFTCGSGSNLNLHSVSKVDISRRRILRLGWVLGTHFSCLRDLRITTFRASILMPGSLPQNCPA